MSSISLVKFVKEGSLSIANKLNAIQVRAKSEAEDFATFPDWFPKSLATVYRNLLIALIVYFRVRSTTFSVSTIRKWIDQRTERAEIEVPFSIAFGPTREAPLSEVTLASLLIDELVRVEYVANLPRKKGLAALRDPVFVLGYSVHRTRKKGGKNSGRSRRQVADDRASRIASYTLNLISSGHDRRQWARMAASSFSVSQRTAREAIKSSGLYDNSPFALPSDFLSRVKIKRSMKKHIKNQYDKIHKGKKLSSRPY
jgi:hypothetical protein